MSNINDGKVTVSALIAALTVSSLLLFNSVNAVWADPNPGAVWTTNISCGGVDLNIYTDKGNVYLNGGPQGGNKSGLPDGDYFVKVTDPSGATLLGKTLTASAQVSGGNFSQCYRLDEILYSVSSNFTSKGYDTTPNNGGEYKVWVSKDGTFPGGSTKTDNFKVEDTTTDPCGDNIDDVCSTPDDDVDPSPTPTATPVATAAPTPVKNDTGYDGGDGQGCATHDCSGNQSSPQGQVLGASTMASTGSLEESVYEAIMTLGATLSAFGLKGLKKSKKVVVKAKTSKKVVAKSKSAKKAVKKSSKKK